MEIKGTWVSIDSKTDTLTFYKSVDTQLLVLSRGYEWINGYKLPKQGSGNYEYELLSDSNIELRYFLSSDARFKEYSIQIGPDTLLIAPFFDSTQTGFIRFKRIL